MDAEEGPTGIQNLKSHMESYTKDKHPGLKTPWQESKAAPRLYFKVPQTSKFPLYKKTTT